MAKTRTRRRRPKKKLKADFIREQMRKGRTRAQAEATYKMLRKSAKHRRQYKLNPGRVRRNGIPGLGHASIDEINIANPGEAEFYEDNRYVREGPLFELWFGAYGSTKVYVWADGFESAFEEAVEWLDDEGLCGYFATLEHSDFVDAAEDLGLSQREAERIATAITTGKDDDYSEEEKYEVIERAETDLTVIGHTSLTNCEKQLGSGPLYIPSWEWGGREVTDQAEVKAVMEESFRREDED